MNEQQIFFAFLLGTLLLTIFTISLGIFLIEHKRKQKENQLEKQKLEYDYKNALLKTRLEEQEKSMTLISEEIHDNIGQVLGLSKMYLHNVLTHVHTEDGKNFGSMAEQLLAQAIKELRHISHSLNSELLEKTGLDNSIEREITFLQETTSIYCSFQSSGTPYKFGREKNVIIFRIAQEALQNAVKHSEAGRIGLSLDYQPNRLVMIIQDDGRGFDIAAAEGNNSLGLRNIRTRSALLHADIDIRTTPRKGTTIELSIPFNNIDL